MGCITSKVSAESVDHKKPLSAKRPKPLSIVVDNRDDSLKELSGQKSLESPLKTVNALKNFSSSYNHNLKEISITHSFSLSLAIAAHNNRKEDLKNLFLNYSDFFNKEVSTIFSTSSTAGYLKNVLNVHISSVPSGKLGGDEVICSKITQGKVDFIIFLTDQLEEFQPHNIAVQSLNRISDIFSLPQIRSEFDLKSFIHNYKNNENTKLNIFTRKIQLQKAWHDLNSQDACTETDNICGSLIYHGMNSYEVSMNIALLKQGNIHSKLFIEHGIINQSQVVNHLNNWRDNLTDVSHYSAIIKLTNIHHDQHALLLQAARVDDKISVQLIDPLSAAHCAEFFLQIDRLLQDLYAQQSVHQVNIVYTGRQDHEHGTCGDMSLIMLQEWTQAINDQKQDNINIQQLTDQVNQLKITDHNEVEYNIVLNMNQDLTHLSQYIMDHDILLIGSEIASGWDGHH